MSEDYETLLTVLDNLMDGLIIIDKEMNVLLFNQSAADLFGVGSIHDVSGVNVFDFVHPEDRERAERIALKDMFEEDLQEINEFRAITADGREIWLSAAGKKIVYNGRTAGLISLRDITKTKIIEESLRESEEKFRLFFETTKDAVAIISQGRFIEFNQATLELLGCTEDELRSRTTGEFYLNPQDREQFLTLLEEKGFVKDYRVDFRRCDGKIVRALMTASALRDSEGNITRIHGITRDITEKLKTEDALRKSESYYKSLFENTLIPVLILRKMAPYQWLIKKLRGSVVTQGMILRVNSAQTSFWKKTGCL